MQKIHLFLHILFTIFITIQSHSSPNSFHITDLTGTTTAKFAFQTSLWNLSGLATSINTSYCGSYLTLGGPDILDYGAILTREYTSLPPHNALYFEIGLVFVDNLQHPDSFILKLDDNIISGGRNLGDYTPYFKSDYCGLGEYPDNPEFTLIGSLPHTSGSLTLELTSLVVSQAAIGIRNINILLVNASNGITTLNSCFRLYDKELMGLEGECKSIKGEYFDSETLENQTCDKSCSDCYGPSSHECFSCNSGSTFTGTHCIKSPQACKSNEYIAPDGTCLTSCPSPLISRLIDSNLLCESPCPSKSEYFHPNNGGFCSNTCENSPSKIKTLYSIKICESHKPDLARMLEAESVFESLDKVIDAVNVMGDIASIGILLSSLSATGNPSAISIICSVKMIQYIRYISIEYPERLQYMLYKQEKSSISLNFNVQFSEDSKSNFPSYSLPHLFEFYGLAGSFIVNYWRGLFTIMMAFVTTITLIFCVWLFSNTKTFHFFSRKGLDIMKWNFFITILCTNIDGIGVPSSMDFRNARFSSSLSVLGTLTCVLFNLVFPALIVSIPFILVHKGRVRAKVWNIIGVPIQGEKIEVSDSQYITLKKKLKTCKVFYKDLRKTTLFHQLALFFVLVRAYLFHLIVGYLVTNPLVQVFFLNIMGILMLLYLGFKRPFRKRLDTFKMIAYESIVALVNLCILVLALLDYNEYEASNARKQVGEIIIVATLMFNTLVVVFLVSDLVLRLIRTYKAGKATTAKGLAFWKTLFNVFCDSKSSLKEAIEKKETMRPEGLQAKRTIRKQFTVKVDAGSNSESDSNMKNLATNGMNTPKSLVHLWPPRINFSDFSSPQNISISSFQSITEGGLRRITPLSLEASNRRSSSQFNLLSPTNMDYIEESNLNLSKKDSTKSVTKRRKDSVDFSASASKSSSPTSSQNFQGQFVAPDIRRRRSTRGRLFSYDNSPFGGSGSGSELGRDLFKKRNSGFANMKSSVRDNDVEDPPIQIKLDYSNLNPSSTSGVKKNTLYNVFVARKR